ncbi:putative orfan [Tupanvirus soda lake]|uniref:Orfan n=2 Tax=Tupanvirus TaxID=2094720 RepID=A0AC62AAV2_9VIRU|nr:putative orfan [Tupanvirus soda lake]QKU34900.1 putative orfan [Tupanvirus soda lake]
MFNKLSNIKTDFFILIMSVVEIVTAFKKLKLDVIHLIFRKRMFTCAKILYNYIDYSTTMYGYFVKEFIDKSCKTKYTSYSREDAIKEILSQTSPCIKIYYENDVNSFVATKFLTDFCKTDIENIMKAFSFVNGIKHFKTYEYNAYCVFETKEVKKIFDMILIMLLGKIFCMISVCQKIAIEEKIYFKTTLKNMRFLTIELEKFICKFGVRDIKEEELKHFSESKKKIFMNVYNKYKEKLELLFVDEEKTRADFKNNPEIFAILCDNNKLNAIAKDKNYEKTRMTNIYGSLFSLKNFFYIMHLQESNGCHEQIPDLKIKIHNIEAYVAIEI